MSADSSRPAATNATSRAIKLALSLAAAALVAVAFALTALASPGDTTRVSVDSAGNQGQQSEIGGASGNPATSADGRFVAFYSSAANLVPGDTNDTYDIFVHDRQAGTTERVSVDSGGNQGNAESFIATTTISADGRFVAFESFASNLVPNDTNGQPDIFVHDRQTGVTERVSVNSAGGQADYGGELPAISADGRFVAFQSGASNLVSNDNNFGQPDIFVHDRQTGTTERVNVDSAGNQSNGNTFNAWPAISADGRFVAFASEATNLVPGDTNGQPDFFVHNRQTGATERVSVDSAGNQSNGYSYDPSAISADGRFVAFDSMATNLVPGDTNSRGDAFVHDRQTGTTERVSVDSAGNQENDNSILGPAISAGGQLVAFTSQATNLVSGDTNGVTDVFVHERGAPTPASVTLTPPDAVNQVGTDHTVTATVKDSSGQPIAAVVARFQVTGSVSTSGSCTTAANGTCTFTYSGPDLPGADLISAYADTDANGSQGTGEPLAVPATKAWILPTSTPGQVTGGGQIANAAANDKIAFGFNAKSDSKGLKGNCNLVDPSTKTKLDCSNVTAMTVSGTQATIYGDAVVNGLATTYKITVNDLGEPGIGKDTFTIHTASGYQVGGTLKAGNVQVH